MKNKTVVLLHGWGCDSTSWAPLLPALTTIADIVMLDLPAFGSSPALKNFSLDALLDHLGAQLPDNCVVMGWSLGGMLAVQLAARYPQKISQLITLASNTKFVANDDYVTAMPLAINQQFNQQFAADPQATYALFMSLLAQGDASERGLRKNLRAGFSHVVCNNNWQPALQLLAELDNRAAFVAMQQPGLHIFGEADVLVPVSAAAALTALNVNQHIKVLPRTAHALHWSQPQQVIALVKDFFQQNMMAANNHRHFKQRVAESFSRAALSYDSVANLQREVGNELLSKMLIHNNEKVVMDLGCGTGYFTSALQKKYPQANIIAVDLAEGMLEVAKQNLNSAVSFVAGDAEALPFANNSVDVIFSSLALQWCHNLPALFSELHRVLTPGGQLIFSTLGPETLYELKKAWQQVDNFVHVNQFASALQVQKNLQQHQFSVREFTQDLPVLQFASLSELTRELKALGAHNVNQGKAEGLTGRKKMLAFKAAYEHYRHKNTLPATYDVFYIAAEKLSYAQ